MTKLVTTKSYERNLKKFIKHHPEMREQYEKTLKMLITDPTHPSLRLHKLQGKLQDLYSVSINMKFRMLLGECKLNSV